MRVARDERELSGAYETARSGGREGLRQRRGLPGEVPRGARATSSSRSSATPRERPAPRRAGVLDPAPPPEADRGGAVAGARREPARAGWGRPRSPRRRRSATPTPGRSSSCSTRRARFYFMEMNTRLQVEHPVTEEVTGVDLVKEQIAVAAGEPLSFADRDAVAARPRDRVPHQRRGPGDVHAVARAASRRSTRPGGLGVRVDTAAYQGYVIPPHYDSLIAKLIVSGRDREEAIARGRRALDLFVVEGIKTTIPMHRRILDDPDFVGRQAVDALHGAVRAGRPKKSLSCVESRRPNRTFDDLATPRDLRHHRPRRRAGIDDHAEIARRLFAVGDPAAPGAREGAARPATCSPPSRRSARWPRGRGATRARQRPRGRRAAGGRRRPPGGGGSAGRRRRARLLPQRAPVGRFDARPRRRPGGPSRDPACDYVAFGPVFESATKTGRPGAGPRGARRGSPRTKTKPLVAIGGITAEHLDAVLDAGADSAAMIGGLLARRAHRGERAARRSTARAGASRRGRIYLVGFMGSGKTAVGRRRRRAARRAVRRPRRRDRADLRA